jgi:hypothetical protein
MNNSLKNTEVAEGQHRAKYLGMAVGCTLLAGTGVGLELGLMFKDTFIGLYDVAAFPIDGFLAAVGCLAWQDFHSTAQPQIEDKVAE